MKTLRNALFTIILASGQILSGCSESVDPKDTPKTPSPTPIYGYQVVNTYPHQPDAFTQGLVIEDGILYESTGQYGASTVRRVDLETGQVVDQKHLDNKFFAEGLTFFNNQLLQITWRENQGFIYDPHTLNRVGVFSYPASEGWGITHNDQELILSDGTSTLYFLDPSTFQETRRVTVQDQKTSVRSLNELEFIDGLVYANVWRSSHIAKINPKSGKVVAWLDLTGILPAGSCTQPIDVLNGIAYDKKLNKLYVTGKYWCSLFEITEIAPTEGSTP